MIRYLKIFTFSIIILLSITLKNKLVAEQIHLNCKIINNANAFNIISKFYKIIDVNKKEIIYQSGIIYDKIKHFNETEIIMYNSIYELSLIHI